MSDDVNMLWSPDTGRVARSNLTEFTRHLNEQHGLALSGYHALYQWSITYPEIFWRSFWQYSQLIADGSAERVLVDGNRMPGAKWFPDLRLNFAENLLSRQDDKLAIVFRSEDKVRRTLSYQQLYSEVARTAQALRESGVVAGDRVAGFMPNMPEAVIAMLATASLGAVWSSSSPDFGVRGVLDRFGQIEPKVLFSADGYHYNGKVHDSLAIVAECALELPTVEKIIVVPLIEKSPKLPVTPCTAVLYPEFTDNQAEQIEFERLPFDHPLYIMYSSGTTGVPKCIVHGAGGTLLKQVNEHRLQVDLIPADRFFYFTTCGWMMWNWLVTGLASGATLMLYDGSPFYPDGNALFDFAQDESISVFGTSAKFIDAAAKAGIAPVDTHSLPDLHTVLSTGSTLAPESFDYVYKQIKSDLCLSSMSGGTDIIGCFAGGSPTLPVFRGELQCRMLGMAVQVFNEQGDHVENEKGELVCTAPFPSMPIGFWNDPDGSKYHDAYFANYANVWCHGDYVELTAQQGMVIHGRSDAVLNPGGVRIGTAEIYRQVEQLDEVLESLVVGQDWQNDVRVILFVRLREGLGLNEKLAAAIRQQIRKNTTPRHVPAIILQVADIPRTKSGKIVELAVRHIIHGRPVRNISALANPEALDLYANLPELQVDA